MSIWSLGPYQKQACNRDSEGRIDFESSRVRPRNNTQLVASVADASTFWFWAPFTFPQSPLSVSTLFRRGR